MAHISLRVSDDEKIIMENYAKWHGINLSEAVKTVFLEKVEDEYDLQLIAEYEADQDNDKTYSHEEVGKMLGLK